MKISFCFEALEFQCHFALRPSKVRKLVRRNQFQVKSTNMGTGRKLVTLQYACFPRCAERPHFWLNFATVQGLNFDLATFGQRKFSNVGALRQDPATWFEFLSFFIFWTLVAAPLDHDLSFWSFFELFRIIVRKKCTGIVCKNCRKQFKGKLSKAQPKFPACLGFFTKLCTKSAVFKSSIALARFNFT